MKPFLSISALSLGLPLLAAEPGAPARLEDARCRANASAIREAIRSVHDAQRNVGLAVLVLSRGRPVFREYLGFADLEHRVAVGAETMFGIASITKAFTGAALLKLVEAGKIDLDLPIQTYVPEFPAKPGGAITPRLLAAHLSGIRHWKNERTAELYAMHFDGPLSILRLFKDDPLESDPGSKYSYSSYGYNLLGAAIERASGMRYERFVEMAILEPLKLTVTAFDDVRRVLPHRARRYSFYDPMTYAEGMELYRVPDWDYSHNVAGGNIVANADELARFGEAFVRPGLLEERSWRLLQTRLKTEKAESPMNFGWILPAPTDSPRVLHAGGSNAGLQASLDVYPEKDLVVVVLSNTWGINSRSADLVSAMPRRVAQLCLTEAP